MISEQAAKELAQSADENGTTAFEVQTSRGPLTVIVAKDRAENLLQQIQSRQVQPQQQQQESWQVRKIQLQQRQGQQGQGNY